MTDEITPLDERIDVSARKRDASLDGDALTNGTRNSKHSDNNSISQHPDAGADAARIFPRSFLQCLYIFVPFISSALCLS